MRTAEEILSGTRRGGMLVLPKRKPPAPLTSWTQLEPQPKPAAEDPYAKMKEMIDAQIRSMAEAGERAAAVAEAQMGQLEAMRAQSEAQLKASEARIKKMEEAAAAKELEAKQRIQSREKGRRKGRPTLLTEMLQPEEPAGKKKTLLGE